MASTSPVPILGVPSAGTKPALSTPVEAVRFA